MHLFLNILLYVALAATAFTLVVGVFAMFRQTSKDREEKNNKLMQLRIMFQAVALIILALLLFMSKGN